VIIPYDSVATVLPELQKGGFDLIIADEATYIKNPKTIRSKALMSLVKSSTWVWAMTGTPVAQSPMDAHGLLMLCKGASSEVPSTMSAFRAEVMDKDPYNDYGWHPKPDAFERVFNMLQPAIRYTKEECLDLPERTYQFREIEMDAIQQKHYNRLKKDGILKLKEGVITAVNAGVMMSKLLQVASGTVYAEDGETIIDFDNKRRLDEMKSIIDGAAHKVIVFCAFRHSTKQVCEYLTECGITWDYINGSKTGNARGATIDTFQTEKDPRVIVIQPKAASHGITLTAADTVIWFNPVTSVDVYLQANDRPHRTGQRNPCTVYHLVSCEVEKKLYAMLDKKIEGQDNLLEMYKDLMSD
jgi:SNF2 family DNA or RNA helicase